MANFSDTFTVASDTLLTAHTPDQGSGWTLLDSTYTVGNLYAKITGGSTVPNVAGPDTNQNSVGVIVKASPDPAASEYDVATRVFSHNWDIGNSYTRGFYGRKQAGVKTMYAVRVYPNAHTENSVALYRVNAGSATELASVDVTLTNGSLLALQLRDAAKKVFLDGVEILSSGDNSLAGPGEAGLFFGNIIGVGAHIDRRQEFDDFSITEVGGGGTGPVEAVASSGALALGAADPSAVLSGFTAPAAQGDLTFTGTLPTAVQGALTLAPAQGAFAFDGGLPTALLGGLTVVAASGQISLAGGAVSPVLGPVAIVLQAGAFALAGGLPGAILGPLSIAVEAGTLSITGEVLATLGSLVVIVPAGQVAFLGSTPTITSGVAVILGPGAVAITGGLAQAAYGPITVPAQPGGLALTGATPLGVFGPLVFSPSAGQLAFLGGPVTTLIGLPPKLAHATVLLAGRGATTQITTTTATAHIDRGRVSVSLTFDPEE